MSLWPSPPRRRSRSRTDSAATTCSSTTTLEERRAGWRPELGPLSDPSIRNAVSLEEGLSRVRREPELQASAISAGLFVRVARRCPHCFQRAHYLILTIPGRDAWHRYRDQLRQETMNLGMGAAPRRRREN